MKRILCVAIMLGLLLSVGLLVPVTSVQANEMSQAGIELQYRKCVNGCKGDADCICDCQDDKGKALRNMELEPCREAYRNCKENCYQNKGGADSCNQGCKDAFKECIGK